ncbi:hypothetical protein IW15_01290 [Chryseobacterium soli]|uniref:ATPase AAA-type core domain-containing protein n=1 Tax=Chryseobacterium soli TaxID=445961 RepID=A0A086ABP5_9FLAO|nr:AAA family ATPase [Chryseobacterium soli]KFF14109.1 hypothetical protein IW15_01290 [Chryseobacterium soli]
MEKITNEKKMIYFSSLELANVKCFGEKPQTLSLKNINGTISPWTLILGNNGIGKTTLLKCLAWMVPVESPSPQIEERLKIAKFLQEQNVSMEIIIKATRLSEDEIKGTQVKKIQIKPSMDDLEDESEYEKIMKSGNDTKTVIRARFSKGIMLQEEANETKEFSIGIKFEKKENKLEVVELEKYDVEEYIAPRIYAYSASRHMVSKNTDDSFMKDPLYNLFSDSGDLYDAEQLLSDLYASSLLEDNKEKEGTITKLLRKLKELLLDLLPDIKNTESIIINPPLNTDGTKRDNLVEIETPKGKVPLFNLSLGYKTMLAWAVDLAIRMLWDNPDSPNPLKEPAVVIIDEIDLHLHPEWQRSLRTYLTQHFTRTQFICTAHSPFMAQASENENLCVLNKIENDDVIINNEPEVVAGWKIGQIITSDLFGIKSERSPEVEEMVKERRLILDTQSKSDSDHERLKTLDEKLSNLPILDDENQKIFEQIKEMANVLKNQNKDDQN